MVAIALMRSCVAVVCSEDSQIAAAGVYEVPVTDVANGGVRSLGGVARRVCRRRRRARIRECRRCPGRAGRRRHGRSRGRAGSSKACARPGWRPRCTSLSGSARTTRRAHRPPRQATAGAAPRRGGDLPGRPDLSAVWRLRGGEQRARRGGSRPWNTPSGRRRGTRRPPRTPRSGSGPVTVRTSSARPRVRRDGGGQRSAMARGGPGRATRIVPVPWPPRPRRGTGRRAGSHARFRARTAG